MSYRNRKPSPVRSKRNGLSSPSHTDMLIKHRMKFDTKPSSPLRPVAVVQFGYVGQTFDKFDRYST